MNADLLKIIKKLPTAAKTPFRAAELFWRRIVPFGIKPKDSEAYRIGSWTYGILPREPINKVFPGIEPVHICLHKVFDRVPDLSLDVNELLIIVSLAKFFNEKNILEIGTYDGNTALNLAVNSPADALITTVDLPPDWNGSLELQVPGLCVNASEKNVIGSQYKDTIYAGKIRQIFCDSAKLDWSKMNVPFDLVFIDGCHAYNYVKSDSLNAVKYLKKPGGIIIWHDYGMIKDVSRFVDEVAKVFKVKVIRGTRLAVGSIK